MVDNPNFNDAAQFKAPKTDLSEIIGGELIAPTAMLAGEYPHDAIKRGWIQALARASKATVSPQERSQNLGAIANEAIRRNILSRAELEAALNTLGIAFKVTEAKPTTERQGLPPIDYDALGKKLPLPQQPRSPDHYFPPAATNALGDNDEPSLAGRVVLNVYDTLINRPQFKDFSGEDMTYLIELSRQGMEEYKKRVNEINEQRKIKGLDPLPLDITRQSGKDGFHFEGEARASRDFLYYFNKSKAHWKREAPVIRAYVTLSVQERQQIQDHFVELVHRLYEAGIDFSGKAGSLFGVTKRTDNIVLYISVYDQPQANDIIRAFLQEKKLGQGHVDAAIPSSTQEGLSWAMEPDEKQNEIWRKITGSTKPASFNGLCAAMAMPVYLERLAEQHQRAGNIQAATEFRLEADRVRRIIAQA